MTARQRADRDQAIVHTRLSGATWREVALRHGLSARQCRRIVAAGTSGPADLKSLDPIKWVEDTYLAYEEAVDVLTEVAETTTNPSAKVGAINAAIRIQAEETTLLQAVGILPHNLGSLAIQLDVQHVAETVMAVFDEFNVSEEAKNKIMGALRVNRRATSPDAAAP